MRELEPNVDVYGTYARASAVADFVELLALHELRPSRAAIADYIGDLSWGAKIHETFLTPEEIVGSDDDSGEGLGSDAEDATERVFTLLADRNASLGEQYPFRLDLDEGRLEVADSAPSPYLALLAITVAHAFKIGGGPNPRTVFEDTVSQALASAGHKSINFSRLRKDHGSFGEALTAAGPYLGLRPVPRAAPVSGSAQDAGADVLAHVSAGYIPGSSVGAWTLVGQVTCGQSDTWGKKLGEVEVPAWKARLGSVVPPQAFLAVPHHAEHRHLLTLVTNSEQMVLDRLRLARMLNQVSGDERAILDAVLNTPVANIALGS